MSTTLNQLIRDQILAEGPQIETYIYRESYVDGQLNTLTNVELLERISDALDVLREGALTANEIATRLGI